MISDIGPSQKLTYLPEIAKFKMAANKRWKLQLSSSTEVDGVYFDISISYICN